MNYKYDSFFKNFFFRVSWIFIERFERQLIAKSPIFLKTNVEAITIPIISSQF